MRIETHTHGPETEKINYGREFLKNLSESVPTNENQIQILQRQKHCKVDYVKKV